MSYKISDQRTKTMLERVGDAAQLIDNQSFLPFYRSIQLKLEKMGKADEWARMIALALSKDQPSRYFAKLCKMVKDGTYKFVEAVKEITGEAALWLSDKLIKFGFGKYHRYWMNKAKEFENVNGRAGLIELLEFAERKGITQRYMAAALKNCKSPQRYYRENMIGSAQ